MLHFVCIPSVWRTGHLDAAAIWRKYQAITRVATSSALAHRLGRDHIVILCVHAFDLEAKGWRACVGHGDIRIQDLLTSGSPEFRFVP